MSTEKHELVAVVGHHINDIYEGMTSGALAIGAKVQLVNGPDIDTIPTDQSSLIFIDVGQDVLLEYLNVFVDLVSEGTHCMTLVLITPDVADESSEEYARDVAPYSEVVGTFLDGKEPPEYDVHHIPGTPEDAAFKLISAIGNIIDIKDAEADSDSSEVESAPADEATASEAGQPSVGTYDDLKAKAEALKKGKAKPAPKPTVSVKKEAKADEAKADEAKADEAKAEPEIPEPSAAEDKPKPSVKSKPETKTAKPKTKTKVEQPQPQTTDAPPAAVSSAPGPDGTTVIRVNGPIEIIVAGEFTITGKNA